MNIKNKRILVTGGSFIGSHLIKSLIEKKPSSIRVVNLTSKHKDFLLKYKSHIEFLTRDLRDLGSSKKCIKGIDLVIHLAADHGGRGYVDLKQGNTASNFLLDGSVFRACLDNDVEKVFFASSGCVYPNFAQINGEKKIYLKESDVKPPYDADNMYGWAKLMGELTLKQYYKDFGLKSAIGRFFTVYGPRASESHAVIGTIAKAFVKQDPFEVWGDGAQIRNWTYVTDIVLGIIRMIEVVDNAQSINLGTTERITVNQMVRMIHTTIGFQPKKIVHVQMPTGPLNRVADISLAKKILGWEPQFIFKNGLLKTIRWYEENKSRTFIRRNLQKLLMHD